MASTQQQSMVLVSSQFAYGDASASTFRLGSALKGSAPATVSVSTSSPSSGCSFTARGSAHKLASRRAMARSRVAAAPFASLSFAAVTLSPPSKQEAPASLGAVKPKKTLAQIVDTASKKALSGGVPGMVAMGIQVLSLMWLRTTINYQYRYGTTTLQALQTLWAQGGIPRFYQGLAPALIQGPLSRFGDTAANTGMLALLEDVDMPVAFKTVAASMAAGAFRIFLMPVDACKTILQVRRRAGARQGGGGDGTALRTRGLGARGVWGCAA
ncbi:hypothetical protein TSOC_003555 [Tetrabaena socialis]|uniref:Uncharacterized protein n=1 Tax=Tetrabaena socialis TaxID=47790 RepID=A0A2J8ABB5_9CHLO|nr:hypothetical protein TSOC_003555 [Tetrabaena socialis]|eukprot:PNH09797.1 hypothetical protein TSOC_003555 [Tetrabaena socialis]